MNKLLIINPNIQTYLICYKCKFIIDNPYETECCGTLICFRCIPPKDMNEKCVKCFKISQYRSNSFIKRLMNQMTLDCAYNCGSKFPSNEIRSHMISCNSRVYECRICEDKDNTREKESNEKMIKVVKVFKGNKKDFLSHMIYFHEEEIIKLNDNYSNKKENIEDSEDFSINEPKESLAMPLIYNEANIRGGYGLGYNLDEPYDY